MNGSAMTVPTNAKFLIVAVADSFYADNVDADGNLAVVVIGSACRPYSGPTWYQTNDPW